MPRGPGTGNRKRKVKLTAAGSAMLAADLGAVHGPDVMKHVDEDRGGPAEVEQAGDGEHRPDEPPGLGRLTALSLGVV